MRTIKRYKKNNVKVISYFSVFIPSRFYPTSNFKEFNLINQIAQRMSDMTYALICVLQ